MHRTRGNEVMMIYDGNVVSIEVGHVLEITPAVAPFPPGNVTIARV
jgi:hypothetical protein